MNKKSLQSSLLLFLAAFIWGVAFVAQSVGMDYMGPYTFNGARFIMGNRPGLVPGGFTPDYCSFTSSKSPSTSLSGAGVARLTITMAARPTMKAGSSS